MIKKKMIDIIHVCLVLVIVIAVGINIVNMQVIALDSFCSDKSGIQEIEFCDYHLPFIGDVGCYINKIDCG